MGFFSWECAVSKKQIMNKHSDIGATPSFLITPDDAVMYEGDYEGYGIFDGRDAYALLYEWNHEHLPKRLQKKDFVPGQENDKYNRDSGIDLFYEHRNHIKFPLKFVRREFYTGQKYNELQASDDAHGQGFWSDGEKDALVAMLSGR